MRRSRTTRRISPSCRPRWPRGDTTTDYATLTAPRCSAVTGLPSTGAVNMPTRTRADLCPVTTTSRWRPTAHASVTRVATSRGRSRWRRTTSRSPSASSCTTASSRPSGCCGPSTRPRTFIAYTSTARPTPPPCAP